MRPCGLKLLTFCFNCFGEPRPEKMPLLANEVKDTREELALEKKKHDDEVARLKALILDTFDKIPADVTSVFVHQGERQSFGNNYKAAETAAIQDAKVNEPFYESVCDELRNVPEIAAKMLSKGARFIVSQDILRDSKKNTYFTEIRVTMDWTPVRSRLASCFGR